MNLELFIARRLLKGRGKSAVSVPIVKIALAGIALGVCFMLLSVFIITGFKKEIKDKLSGFFAHMNVVSYGNILSPAEERVSVSDTLLGALRGIDGVKDLYVYVTKPAILKSDKEIHGVVLNGVDSLYTGDFFKKNLLSGEFPDYRTPKASDEILISSAVAAYLGLQVGDRVGAHFVQDPPRLRSFTVKGIYETGFKEYDDVFAICDIRHLQRLNAWKGNEVTGIALELTDLKDTQKMEEKVEDLLYAGNEEAFYSITTLRQTAPQLFDWLELINMNVWIILVLIVTVAGFNMVSGLLILILDKTVLIGILKALGYKDINLRKLFLYISVGLIGRGLIWGNILALLLGGAQYYGGIVHLDPASYYMDTVPVYFNVYYILLLDIGVLVVSTLMLVVPTMLISRINPIQVIRFE